MTSPAADLIALAKRQPDPGTALALALSECTDLELAALEYDWDFWARDNQHVPAGDWRSFMVLSSRRWGKTRSLGEFVIGEARSGRAPRIGFCAQTEDKAIEVMVEGECGLISRSPPWFAPKWERNHLTWPNGAKAFPFTPEKPGNIRGPGVQLFWASEIQSWPVSTREEAFHNASLMTSLGYAKMLIDGTPKRRHPLIRMLLRDAEVSPEAHIVMGGRVGAFLRMEENESNLGKGIIDDFRSRLGGTQRGREEVDGIFSEDDDGAMWKQTWIDRSRRDPPLEFRRRTIAIDPATTTHATSDDTGIIETGLGFDNQLYPLGDYTAKWRWEEWADKVLDVYVAGKCDCILIETNAGGKACAANLRARGESRERIDLGITLKMIEVDDNDPPPRFKQGFFNVKVVHAGKSKEERAVPIVALTEQGRVSFPRTKLLEELEEELCTWEPSPKNISPNRLDAFVWSCTELSGILAETTNPHAVSDALAMQRTLGRAGVGGIAARLRARIGAGGGRGRL